MIVGVPKEVKADEYRVAITPAGVRELTAAGHTVYVEKEAGVGSSIPDEDFVATGATILDDPDDIWAAADLVLGVKEPIAVEYPRLGARKDQVLFTYLHLAASRPCTEALVAGGNTAIAYETVRLAGQLAAAAHPDERGGRPHGPADGRPPPHAPGRRPRHAGLRRARRALRQDRDPRRRRGRHGRRHPGRRHARRGLHPRPQPRAPAPGRPPLPRRPGDGGLVAPTPSRRCASTPTSSSAPCWSSGPRPPS